MRRPQPGTLGAERHPNTPRPPALPGAMRLSHLDREPSPQAPCAVKPAASAPPAQVISQTPGIGIVPHRI